MSSVLAQSILGLYLNPDVRTLFKGHLTAWMFAEEWTGKFVECLDQPAYENRVPDIHEFVVDIHSNFGVSARDCDRVADIFADYRPPSNMDKVVALIQDFIRESHLSQGVELIAIGADKDHKERGIASISYGIGFQVGVDSFTDFTDDSQIEEARLEDLPADGKIIKSSFSVINRSLTYGGYKYGDLVMVAAESGVGKSTLLVTEGAHFTQDGLKVAHIVLGDLSRYDMFLKYLAAYNNVEAGEILQGDYREWMSLDIQGYFANLRIKVLAPDTFDIHQLLAKASQLYQKFKFDVLIVDYDGNIRDVNPDSSSYAEGGLVYANLKGYGHKRCLVMIASQTKIQYWGEEIVLKNFANDSSKKQHHLDLMLGLGRNKECPKVGTLNLPKVRRGFADRRIRVRLDNGKGLIKEISQDEYERVIAAHKAVGNISYDYQAIMTGADR